MSYWCIWTNVFYQAKLNYEKDLNEITNIKVDNDLHNIKTSYVDIIIKRYEESPYDIII